MNSIRRFFAAGLALTSTILFALPLTSHAEVSFSVSPIRVELAGEPGENYSDTIEINNEGNEKVRIKVTMQDWYLSEEGTPIFQKSGAQPHSLTRWLKINPVDFLLQPKEKKVVRFSVAVPGETAAGGYWGTFVFETVPQVEPGQKTKAVALKGNISSIMYTIVGKPVPVGELLSMSHAVVNREETITVRLNNTGTVQYRLKGDLKILDATGKPVQTVGLPDAPVLPGFTRTFALGLKDKLPVGKYTAVATIDIGAKALLAGEIPFSVK